MAFASEFDRLRERMEQSRAAKDEPVNDTAIGAESEDEQIFNSSIRQLWQQAVNVHMRNTENDADEVAPTLEEADSQEQQEPSRDEELSKELNKELNEELAERLGQAEQTDLFLEEDSLVDELAMELENVEPLIAEMAAAVETVEHTFETAVEETVEVEQAIVPSFSEEYIENMVVQDANGDMTLLPGIDETVEQPLEEQLGAAESVEVTEATEVETTEAVESLAQISLEVLQKEAQGIIELIYNHHYSQLGDLFSVDIPNLEEIDFTKTKLGKDLKHICDVVTSQGKVSEEARQAVDSLLPILWKAMNDQTYRVPEDWYQTQLGFLFHYIRSGSATSKFDPIDLSTAATMLHMSEKDLINIYPKLGGVKLTAGYVFSRQRIEEYKNERTEMVSPITIETLQAYYRNTKDCLTKLIRIHHFMSECSDEIRYVRDLLISGSDFSRNRIKQPIKQLIEQRLAVLYKKYQEVNEFNFKQVEVGHNELVGYVAPNVFAGLEQCNDSTMNGDLLAGMLESIIKLIDDERTQMNEITVSLTKNLGQLNIEIEMLKIKESL